MEFDPPLTMSDQCMLRKLIKTQIQLLIDQLQQQTDTETFIVLGHRSTDFEQIGSNKGLQFLSSVGRIGSQFTEYIQTGNLEDDKERAQSTLQDHKLQLTAHNDNADSDCSSVSDIFNSEEEDGDSDYEIMDIEDVEDDKHSKHPVVKTEVIPGGYTEDFNGIHDSNWDTENKSNDEKRLEETHFEQPTAMNDRYEASASIAVAANVRCNVPETVLGGKALQEEPPAIKSQLQGEELLQNATSQHYEKNKVEMDMRSEDFSNDGHEENMSLNEKVLEKTHLEQSTIIDIRSLASVSIAKEMGSLSLPEQLIRSKVEVDMESEDFSNDSHEDETEDMSTVKKEMTENNTVVGIQSGETSSNDVDGIETQGFLSETKHILSADEVNTANGGCQETGRTDEVSQHDNIAADLNTTDENNENACHVESRYSKYSKPEQSHSQSKTECKTCGKHFKSTGNLRDHMTTHDGISRVHCFYCNEKFKWRSQRRKHIKKQHCDILEQKLHAKGTKSSKFGSKATKTVTLKVHMLPKKASNSIKKIKNNSHCDPDNVNKMFTSVLGPVSKPLPVHLKKKKVEAKTFPKRDALTCIKGTGFSLKLAIKRSRLHTKYPGKPKCKYCSKNSRTMSELKEHEHKHTGVYSCWKCESNFSEKKTLREHVKECRKVPSFKAVEKKPLIEEKSSLEENPVAEKKSVTGKTFAIENFAIEKKSFNKCQKCKKPFMYTAILKKHESVCGMASAPKSLQKKTDGLKNTDKTLSHFGKKVTSFQHKKYRNCQKCNKTFLYPTAFKQHENVCNVVKVCGEKAPSGLQNAIKTNKKLKFPCVFCSRTFNTRFEVFRHLCVHTKEARFTCRFCPEKFKWVEQCKRHELMIHENDLPVRNLHLSTSVSRELGQNVTKCNFCNIEFENEIFSVHIKCCKALRNRCQMDSSAVELSEKRDNVDEDEVVKQTTHSNHTVQDKPGNASSVENFPDFSPNLGHTSVTKSSPSKPQDQPGGIEGSPDLQTKQNYQCAVCNAHFNFSREIIEHIEDIHKHEML